MIWGLLIVVAVVAFVIWLVVGGGKIAKQHDQRFATGTPAMATITRVEQPGSGSPAHGTVVLRLFITVTPPSGPAYPAVTGIRIKMVHLPQAQPGESLSVRIATDNPQLVYPDVDWAERELVTISRAGRGRYPL